MAKTDNLTDFLTGVANAIRTKKGTTAKINPQNFETEISSITTSKPEQEKTTDLSMLNGNQIISPDSGKVLSKVTITKPATLTPENIKKDTNIGGVVGTLEEAKPEQEKTAEPTNARQTILPDSGKTLSKVVIKSAPLPTSGNSMYDNTNGCLIARGTNTLLLGCEDSIIPTSGSVTSIGAYAFYNCKGLTSVTIPDSVTSIGEDAFHGCSGLTSLTIPDGVTLIKDYAFEGCRGLTSITIPNSVTSIGAGAFSFCRGIESLVVTMGNKKYHSVNNCIIETNTKTLIVGCKTSVIPSDGSVISIGHSAFSGSGLTSITIPNSVTSIGYSAFSSCIGLTSITIPNSVTSIDNAAFASCEGLTSVTIGNSVTLIGNQAFYACHGLTSITIPDSVTSIDENAFGNCDGIESLVVTPGNTKYHSANNCIIETESKTLILGCKNSVIPSDGSATSIGGYAFSGCSGLTYITIPNSVTSIGGYAFRDCSGLISVTIGNSVTSIGERAFSWCSGLTSVTMLPTNPPTLGSNAIPSNVTTITVPVGCGDAYKTAEGWSAYADKIVETTA